MSGSVTISNQPTTVNTDVTTDPFKPYQILTAQELNTALKTGNKTGGILDNVQIGVNEPATGVFTSLIAPTMPAGDSSTHVATTAFVLANGGGGGGGGGGSITIPTAQLLGGNGTALTPITVSTGLHLQNGVLTNTVTQTAPLTVPTSTLLGGNGSALTSVTLGTGLTLVNGALTVTVSGGSNLAVPNANLVGGNGTALTSITVGSGLSFSGGVLSNPNTTTGLAPLASPTFTGSPTISGSPPAANDSTTKVATTAFVQSAASAAVAGAAGSSFTGTGTAGFLQVAADGTLTSVSAPIIVNNTSTTGYLFWDGASLGIQTSTGGSGATFSNTNPYAGVPIIAASGTQAATESVVFVPPWNIRNPVATDKFAYQFHTYAPNGFQIQDVVGQVLTGSGSVTYTVTNATTGTPLTFNDPTTITTAYSHTHVNNFFQFFSDNIIVVEITGVTGTVTNLWLQIAATYV